jgi:glycosyl transferase family 25
MRIIVISLERTPARLSEFRERNGHLQNMTVYKAIDGLNLCRDNLAARGLIEPPTHYSDGALGCMMSHRSVWEHAAATGEITTVCEDDAIFHHAFEASAMKLLATLPDDTGIVYWGWNFNAHTAFETAPGVAPSVTTCGRNPLRQEIDAFQRSSVQPSAFRLLRAMGIVCYTITPLGARRLKRLCLPVRNEVWDFPETKLRIANVGIDVAMANALPHINAYCSFPPLVMTLNDLERSTIQTHRALANAEAK